MKPGQYLKFWYCMILFVGYSPYLWGGTGQNQHLKAVNRHLMHNFVSDTSSTHSIVLTTTKKHKICVSNANRTAKCTVFVIYVPYVKCEFHPLKANQGPQVSTLNQSLPGWNVPSQKLWTRVCQYLSKGWFWTNGSRCQYLDIQGWPNKFWLTKSKLFLWCS